MEVNKNSDNPIFHEKVFTEIGNIISACFDFLTDKEASNLNYIYAFLSYEEGVSFFDLCCDINNVIKENHQIGDKKGVFDALDPLFDYVIHDVLKKLKDIFEFYELRFPTEIKITYTKKTENLKYNFEYEPQWSHLDGVLPVHMCEKWFEEIKLSLENI